MSVLEAMRIALTALGANRMRSALTTLGVIIGVAAVITMVALGEGAKRDVQERISKLGSNLLYIVPGQAEKGHIWRGIGSAETLTVDDAKALKAEVPQVAGSAPEMQRNVQLKAGIRNGDFRVIGTLPDYKFVRNVELTAGRFFTALEQQGRRRVCVLGANVAETLFEGDWAIGKRVKIKGVPFTVVGVRASLGGFGRDDDNVVIPLSTYRQRLGGDKYVRMIAISGKDGLELSKVEDASRRFLRRRHRLRPSDKDDFSIATQSDIQSTMAESTKTFSLLLAGIASISLLVGGIGIMNIMLVTVTERTREIGIRKALGARRQDIQLQFLIESTVLSVFGGTLGIILGVSLSWLIRTKFGLSAQVAPSSVLLAFGCAAGIGIFFGYYPASQAGKLDPIQALRYE